MKVYCLYNKKQGGYLSNKSSIYIWSRHSYRANAITVPIIDVGRKSRFTMTHPNQKHLGDILESIKAKINNAIDTMKIGNDDMLKDSTNLAYVKKNLSTLITKYGLWQHCTAEQFVNDMRHDVENNHINIRKLADILINTEDVEFDTMDYRFNFVTQSLKPTVIDSNNTKCYVCGYKMPVFCKMISLTGILKICPSCINKLHGTMSEEYELNKEFYEEKEKHKFIRSI